MAFSSLSRRNSLPRFQSALDRARAGNLFDVSTSGAGTFPAINIFRDGEDFIAVAELPGVRREDIDVQVHRNRMRITGSKTVDYGDTASIHRRERKVGRFDRTIALPMPIDPSSVSAEFRNGILALKFGPPEEDKPRSISVA